MIWAPINHFHEVPARTNLPADLTPETAAWLHAQMAINNARTAAVLREEINKVDDWTNGTMLRIPDVIGVQLTGQLRAGVLATDLALTVTSRLRAIGVSGEFVEFYGPGVSSLSAGDRAVVANMAPEYGATTGFFPVDKRTLDYLEGTGRASDAIDRVKLLTQSIGQWFDPQATPTYTRTIEIDLGAIDMHAA